MKAKLLPLDGKYYGTEVEILDDNGNTYIIKLWGDNCYIPSHRELRDICTVDQWKRNEWLPDEPNYDGGKGVFAREAFEICDSHFESEDTYNLAMKIVDLINGRNG